MKLTALLIGDSICMGYRPFVKQKLMDKAKVIGIDDNGGDSGNILQHFDEWILNKDFDLIHFNCGLHDLKVNRTTGEYQQPIEVYEQNLKQIIKRLKEETNAKLVWATITPVIDERHNAVKDFNRHQKDVIEYNKVATDIMTEANIAIDDLFSVIMNDILEDCLLNDGVHMSEHGNELLTEVVSNCVLKELDI
jgi:lysophospholipase L1-like esterase